jgi:hypothetical protein
VYGRARKWRAIRAIPSEPVLNAKRKEHFLNFVDAKSIFRTSKPNSLLTAKPELNKTTSYALRAAKLAFSVSASNPSHVATSYAVPIPELSWLFVT